MVPQSMLWDKDNPSYNYTNNDDSEMYEETNEQQRWTWYREYESIWTHFSLKNNIIIIGTVIVCGS